MENIVKLNNIFIKHTKFDFCQNEKLQKELFFGKALDIPVRELLLVLFDIEKTFNIKIPEKILLDGKFKNFQEVRKILKI